MPVRLGPGVIMPVRLGLLASRQRDLSKDCGIATGALALGALIYGYFWEMWNCYWFPKMGFITPRTPLFRGTTVLFERLRLSLLG
jgi:hypothetical protein